MRRPATVDSGGTPQEWFRDLPVVTKILFTSTLFFGACATFDFISPMTLIFYWPNIYQKFEIWRLFTAFTFAGSFSFPFAMHLYMLYQNSLRYESNPFSTGARGSSADYLFMILFSMAVLSVLGYIFDAMMLSEPLLYVIMYAWSRKEPDAQTNIFGFKFKALYLPWVYVAIRMLMGNPITGPLLGIGCGHFYYFLADVLPISHGYDLLRTPNFCVDIVEYLSGRSQPNVVPVRQQPTAAGAGGGFARGGYNWGGGRTLGTN
jgi:hypothetical protein